MYGTIETSNTIIYYIPVQISVIAGTTFFENIFFEIIFFDLLFVFDIFFCYSKK